MVALKTKDAKAFEQVQRLIELIPAKHDTEKESALRVLKQLRRGIKKMYRDYLVLKPAFKVSADSKFRMLKRINDSVSCVSDDDEADETYSGYNMLRLYKIGEDVKNIVDMLSDVPVPTAEQRAAVKGVLVPSPLRKEELAEALPKPAEPAADAAAADAAAADAAAAAATSVSASSETVPKKEEDEKIAKEKAAKKLRKEAKKGLQSDDEDDDDEDDDDDDDDDDDEKEEGGWYDQLDEIRSIVMRIAKKHSKSMIFIAEMNDKKKSSEEKDDDMDDGEKEEKESEPKEKEKPKKDTEGTATEGMKE